MAANTCATLNQRGRRILIVEDNADGRESLSILLSMLGHRVEVAADGIDGVRKALEMQPDVAIVDIGLPGLDGYEVARQVRAALGKRVRLVAYTAYDRAEAGRRVKEAGFDMHCVKPASMAELTASLSGGRRCA